jgi:hypothetical protein
MNKNVISSKKSKNSSNASATIQKVSNQISTLTGLLNAKFVNDREQGLEEAYSKYSRNIMADYIYGLYHPDVVFEENLDIKSPSYLPIPTTNFRFKETITFSPNQNGNFCLHWEPNFLGTESNMLSLYPGTDGTTKRVFSNLTINNYDELVGNVPTNIGWRAAPFKNVAQDFSKYRLTSACIKVKYTGKVIEQCGMFAASATYKDTFRTIMFRPDDFNEPYYNLPEVVRNRLANFGDFDNVRQGQWAKTTSVVSNPDGLTCIYVPTDPLNQVFVNNATTIDSTNQSIVNVDNDYNVYSWLTKNANISYVICGYSLPPYAQCITVETYYNFEIIVNQEQMPYFNPKVPDRDLLRYKDVIVNVSGLVSSSGLITNTNNHESKDILSRLKSAFRRAKNLYNDYYPLISPLLKLLV